MQKLKPKILKIQKLSGFTLIELIIVVAILGILAAAIPKFFRTEDYILSTFTREALGCIRYAQKKAIGMGCHIQVSVAANKITLKTRTNCTTGPFTVDVIDPDKRTLGYEVDVPSGINITPINFPIYFDRGGRVFNSSGSIGDAQLQINTKILTIIGETGYSYEN